MTTSQSQVEAIQRLDRLFIRARETGSDESWKIYKDALDEFQGSARKRLWQGVEVVHSEPTPSSFDDLYKRRNTLLERIDELNRRLRETDNEIQAKHVGGSK